MITLRLSDFGVLVGLAVPCVALLVWIFNVTYRFQRLERHDREAQQSRALLLEGVVAALNGLIQLGANGPVSDAEKKLKDYMIQR